MKLVIPEIAEGELYVGAVVDKDGSGHHVILLPGDNDGAGWQAQMEWAKSIGGDLPSRVEQAMLWANHRDQFQKRAYWSNEQDDDPDYSGWAWFQDFSTGYQASTSRATSCAPAPSADCRFNPSSIHNGASQ